MHIKLGKSRAYTHKKKKSIKQTAMGKLVFIVVLHLLQATLYPFHLINIFFYKKIGVVGIQLGSISIINNAGLLLGRICVNEDFYDLLAQVITFHIILKSVIFEKKTKREIAT